jgi:hypothetical protein
VVAILTYQVTILYNGFPIFEKKFNMKKIIITAILGLFLTAGLQAQAVTLPTFKNETVIINQFTSAAKGEATLTDGDTYFETDLKPINVLSMTATHANTMDNQKKMASIMNQLKKQGYKLISTIIEGYFTTYYFQKE